MTKGRELSILSAWDEKEEYILCVRNLPLLGTVLPSYLEHYRFTHPEKPKTFPLPFMKSATKARWIGHVRTPWVDHKLA